MDEYSNEAREFPNCLFPTQFASVVLYFAMEPTERMEIVESIRKRLKAWYEMRRGITFDTSIGGEAIPQYEVNTALFQLVGKSSPEVARRDDTSLCGGSLPFHLTNVKMQYGSQLQTLSRASAP